MIFLKSSQNSSEPVKKIDLVFYDGVEGDSFHIFFKCSFIESDVDALFDRFGKNETVLLLVYDEGNDAAKCLKPDAMCRRLSA